MKDRHSYSKAFKLHVMEDLRDGRWKNQSDAAAAYGLRPSSIHVWMRQLGFEHLEGRTIHMKSRSELDEIKRLKTEHRRLKERLVDESSTSGSTRRRCKFSAAGSAPSPKKLEKRLAGNSLDRGQNSSALGGTHLPDPAMTRQNCCKARKARKRGENREGLVLPLVWQERAANQRAGTKKLMAAIRPELEEASLAMGRNRLGALRKRNGLLVEKRKSFHCRTTRQDLSLPPSPNEERHCHENAKAERLDGILKGEYFLNQTFRTKAEPIEEIKETVWIYNHRRLHGKLGYKTPAAFRREWGKEAA
jgi:transposase-like protein